GLPSLEPLSTTITSSGRYSTPSSEARHWRVSTLPFQERTTTATLWELWLGISAIGAMIIDTYAPVRRMNSEIQPVPDPATPVAAREGSHAPAVLRSSALQIGGHIGAIALTAASTIVLTRFLGVEDYGRFTVLT